MEQFLIAIFVIFVCALGINMTIFDLPGNSLLMIMIAIMAFATTYTVDNMLVAAALALFIFGEVWDFFIQFYGIKREKVSWFAFIGIFLGGLIGTTVGTSVVPVVGSFIGGCLGSFLAAFFFIYMTSKDKEHALQVAITAVKTRFFALSGKILVAILLSGILVYIVVWTK